MTTVAQRIPRCLYKGSKLAEDGQNRRGLPRRPLLEQAGDSGIDSDDCRVQRSRAQGNFEILQLNETGSSDEELFLRAPPPQLAKRRDVDQTLNDSSSSDDELVLRSPRPNWGKSKYEGQMKTIEEADRELLIPMLEWQRPRLDDSDTMLPESPEHSSSPLYEVELTASDEEEGSIIELVMPLKSRHGPDATFIPSLKDCREIFSYMIKLLCCWNSSL
ncbi:uncharacterized protein LOC120633439 [Pararge aegeria]|uniref:uncharacterized protein LOC120633439 n=1 Tax=Pararge aegeria TaxID=116150 RepID=UPI0019D1DAD8|nr:uncharacterized protein LOC120633439 [Pararge aegeria]